jgi:hypothetical protein
MYGIAGCARSSSFRDEASDIVSVLVASWVVSKVLYKLRRYDKFEAKVTPWATQRLT